MDLRARQNRYEDAGVLGRAALRFTGAALTGAQREELRRREIGSEGRIAEDVIRSVRGCEPIWSLLAEKDIFEDLTTRELEAIGGDLLGRPVDGWADASAVDVSVKFVDREHVAQLRRIIPGDVHPEVFNAYRYATLTPGSVGSPEPFVMALSDDGSGENDVVAAMLVGAIFLRHERELGSLTVADVGLLEQLVRADLQKVHETYALLLDA